MTNKHHMVRWSFIICIFLLFTSLIEAQETPFFSEDKDKLSPYELPKNVKLSQEIQTLYTELQSQLYNDRNATSKSLAEKEAEKKKQLAVQGAKDINLLNKLNSDIEQEKKSLTGINYDINRLSRSIEGNPEEKNVLKLIASIQSARYGKTVVQDSGKISQDKSQDKEWNKEFAHLGKKKNEINFQSDCKLIFNGIDPQSLEKKLQTDSENLISYTHPKLEEYYKEDPFLSSNVSIVTLGKDKYLTLDIVIKSRDDLRNYGMIQAGSPMKIEMINGDAAYIFAQNNATGRPIAQTNDVRYQVLYPIPKSEYKILKKGEIDNVGLMWSSGYEKYDVYNVDVVQKQLACIENY